MNLQLFSQERTEDPSPRRLQKAREEGQAPRSADLAAGIGLVVSALALQSLGPSFYEQLARGMTEMFTGLKAQELTPDGAHIVFQNWTLLGFRVFVPFAGIILVVGTVTGLLQTGFLFSSRGIKVDFNRINPIQGLRRIFSLRTLVEMIKGLLKLGVIGAIAYRDIAALLPAVPGLMGQTVALGASTIATRGVAALKSIGFGMLAIGIIDYGYQYWEFRKSIRMTKEEVRQEIKEQEGSPEVRQKRHQRQRELAMRRRALREVPKADVVVTNPTHLAVALRYQPEKSSAPRVVAKGAGELAQWIKGIAEKHGVPLVENRPLARNLYTQVPLGKSIPPELYQAVAEVLAFVYSLRRQEREQQNRQQ